mgnify:CR=1 FL=1
MLLFFESDACVHGGVLVQLAGGGISGIVFELTFSCVPVAGFFFQKLVAVWHVQAFAVEAVFFWLRADLGFRARDSF